MERGFCKRPVGRNFKLSQIKSKHIDRLQSIDVFVYWLYDARSVVCLPVMVNILNVIVILESLDEIFHVFDIIFVFESDIG